MITGASEGSFVLRHDIEPYVETIGAIHGGFEALVATRHAEELAEKDALMERALEVFPPTTSGRFRLVPNQNAAIEGKPYILVQEWVDSRDEIAYGLNPPENEAEGLACRPIFDYIRLKNTLLTTPPNRQFKTKSGRTVTENNPAYNRALSAFNEADPLVDPKVSAYYTYLKNVHYTAPELLGFIGSDLPTFASLQLARKEVGRIITYSDREAPDAQERYLHNLQALDMIYSYRHLAHLKAPIDIDRLAVLCRSTQADVQPAMGNTKTVSGIQLRDGQAVAIPFELLAKQLLKSPTKTAAAQQSTEAETPADKDAAFNEALEAYVAQHPDTDPSRIARLYKIATERGGRLASISLGLAEDYIAAIIPEIAPNGEVVETVIADNPHVAHYAAYVFDGAWGLEQFGSPTAWEDAMTNHRWWARLLGAIQVPHTGNKDDFEERLMHVVNMPAHMRAQMAAESASREAQRQERLHQALGQAVGDLVQTAA